MGNSGFRNLDRTPLSGLLNPYVILYLQGGKTPDDPGDGGYFWFHTVEGTPPHNWFVTYI